MNSESSSAPTPPPSPRAKPATSPVSDRLTKSESEQLRQNKRALIDSAQNAFAKKKKKK